MTTRTSNDVIIPNQSINAQNSTAFRDTQNYNAIGTKFQNDKMVIEYTWSTLSNLFQNFFSINTSEK